MNNVPIATRARHSLSSPLVLLVFLTLLAAPTETVAVEMPDLYTADVAYNPARRDGRKLAYAAALREVVARISPNPAAINRAETFGDAGQYVLGWREGANGRLWVSFDGQALTEALRASGQPAWGNDRPLTLVWLAVESRDGGRELVPANGATAPSAKPTAALPDDSVPPAETIDPIATLRDELRAASQHSGVPVSFPLLDERDRAAVTDSDVWGGFNDVILAASQRYGTASVLVGRARGDRPTSIRWTWLFAGAESSFSGPISRAIATVSGRMMQELASNPAASADVRISVVGINGMHGYAKVFRYLTTQSLIQDVRVLAIRADEVLFEVDSLTTRDRIAQMLDGSLLERLENPVRAVLLRRGSQVIAPISPLAQVDQLGAMPSVAGEAVDDAPVSEEPPLEPGQAPRAVVFLPRERIDFSVADLFFRVREQPVR